MKMTQLSASKFWTEGYSSNVYLFYMYELNYVSVSKLWNTSDQLSSKLTIQVKEISNTGLTNTAIKRLVRVRESNFAGQAQNTPKNSKGQLKKKTAVLQNGRKNIARSCKSSNRLKI